MSRRGALVVGAGLVAAFALAQGWAIYGVLGAPDVFLGGVIMERLADLQTLSHGPPQWTARLQTLLLTAGLASFAASSIALRERLSMPVAEGTRSTGPDRGRWAAVIGLAGLAALWHIDPWRLIVLSLGVSAAALGPATLWRRADARAATAGGIVGLVLFAALTLVAALPGAAPIFAPAVAAAGRAAWPEALRKAVLTYPAAHRGARRRGRRAPCPPPDEAPRTGRRPLGPLVIPRPRRATARRARGPFRNRRSEA